MADNEDNIIQPDLPEEGFIGEAPELDPSFHADVLAAKAKDPNQTLAEHLNDGHSHSRLKTVAVVLAFTAMTGAGLLVTREVIRRVHPPNQPK